MTALVLVLVWLSLLLLIALGTFISTQLHSHFRDDF